MCCHPFPTLCCIGDSHAFVGMVCVWVQIVQHHLYSGTNATDEPTNGARRSVKVHIDFHLVALQDC